MRLSQLSSSILLWTVTSLVSSTPTTVVATPSSEPCHVCGMESMTVESGLTTIFNGEEYACEDLQDWGTQHLFDEVTCQLTTLLVTNDCNCAPAISPVGITPVTSPKAAREIETAFPTYTDVCYVCNNDPDLTVTSGLLVTVADVEFSCEIVEQIGLDRLAGGTFCQLLTTLVLRDCNCVPRGGLATAAPSQSPTVETPFPTASEPCYVCGDSSLSVQPTLTTMLGEDEFSCGDLELFGQLRLFGDDTCPLVTLLVTSDCGCTPNGRTEAPAPVQAPSAMPEDTNIPCNLFTFILQILLGWLGVSFCDL